MSKRIAFALCPLTGDELKAGNRDVARVFHILTSPDLGKCCNESSMMSVRCKDHSEFNNDLRCVTKNWSHENQLVFYFTGHGKEVNGIYCLQAGMTSDDLIPFSSVLTQLKIREVSKAIFILDTCCSGSAAINGLKSDDGLEISSAINKINLPKGIAILASSRAYESSRELPDGSSSVFTEIFCDGIENGLDGTKTQEGYITIENIANYAEKKLGSEKKYSSFNQRPVFSIKGANDSIWISLNPSGAIEKSSSTKNKHERFRTIEEVDFWIKKNPEKQPCPEIGIHDLDWDLVESLFKYRYKEESIESLSKEEVLRKLHFYSHVPYNGNPVIHKSAVLCFAKNPSLFYEQARSIFTSGKPGSKEFVRHDIKGPLAFQLRELLKYIENRIEPQSFILKDGNRESYIPLDIVVVRELISNALTHRDYNHNSVVTISWKEDSLEIRSPGLFLDEVQWEELLDNEEMQSYPVNPCVSYYLTELVVFEGVGRGFSIFREYVKKYGKDGIVYKILPKNISLFRIPFQKPPNERTIYSNPGNISDSIYGDKVTSKYFYEAPKSEKKCIRLLPSNIRDTDFLRKEELKYLDKYSQQPQPLILVGGIGGTGKSYLCRHWFHQCVNENRYENYIWISCSKGILSGFQESGATHELGIEPEDISLKLVVSKLNHLEKCLLALDDIQYDQEGELEKIRALHIGPQYITLIATARHEIEDFDCIRLDFLSLEDCKKLFYRFYSIQKDDDTLVKIIEMAGFHTLTIELLAKTAKKGGKLLNSFHKELIDKGFDLSDLKIKYQKDGSQNSRLIEALDILFDLSTLTKSQQQLVGLLARLDSSLFDIRVIEKWFQLSTLADFHEIHEKGWLIKGQEDKDEYWLHQVISESIRKKLSQLDEKTIDNVLNVMNTSLSDESFNIVYPGDYHLLPHIEAFAKYSNNQQTELIAFTYNWLGYRYSEQAYYQKAEYLYKRALAIYENVLGAEHPDTANSLNNLALLYHNQGLYEQAEPLYQRALKIREKALGPEHPDTATNLNDLAQLYVRQGRYSEAEPLYGRALTIRKQIFGTDHPEKIAAILNNLAELYNAQGQYERAEHLNKKALEIYEEAFESEHPYIALSINNLAGLYDNQGMYEQAETLYKKALKIYENILGPEHPDVAISLNKLALLYRNQGLYEQAEPLLQRALEIREKVLGREHPDTATSLNSLALLYRNKGLYKQAEPLLQRALKIREEVLGGEHPDTATSLNSLALLYRNQGLHEQAEPLLQRALEIREKALGSEHPDTVISLKNLSELYDEQNLCSQSVSLDPFVISKSIASEFEDILKIEDLPHHIDSLNRDLLKNPKMENKKNKLSIGITNAVDIISIAAMFVSLVSFIIDIRRGNVYEGLPKEKVKERLILKLSEETSLPYKTREKIINKLIDTEFK